MAPRILFRADDGTHGQELWVSDGTSAGTRMVADINSGSENAMPRFLTPLGDGRAIFRADDGTHGRELWITDGTGGGTRMVSDIEPGPGSGLPRSWYGTIENISEGEALFQTDSNELWVTDGSETGTMMVSDIKPQNLTAFGDGSALFFANDGVHGEELWITNGAETGTMMVADIYPGSSSSVHWFYYPQIEVVENDRAVFSADDGTRGRELWVTDGTESGTRMLADIAPGSDSSGASGFTPLGENRAMFLADDGRHGRELWITNGTETGTRMVADIATGNVSSGPGWITPLESGSVLFFANDGTHGDELWITDGSAAGTQMIRDIDPMQDDRLRHREIEPLGDGRALFNAYDGTPHGELWITDGTQAGTHRVAEINPGYDGGNPSGITAIGNGRAVFRADDGTHGEELWITDGSESGTRMISDINPSGESALSIFAVLDDAANGGTPDNEILPDADFLSRLLVEAGVSLDDGSREVYNPDGTYAYHYPSGDQIDTAPGYEFLDGGERRIDYETSRFDTYFIRNDELWLENQHGDEFQVTLEYHMELLGWDFVSQVADDSEAFAITRNESGWDEAETFYVSTVQDQGSTNDGVYEGLLNEPLEFDADESTRFVTVDWLENRDIDTDQSFSLIVQDDPSDPIDTHLARTEFTVPPTGDNPSDPGDEPGDPPPDPDEPYRPTKQDLEYMARVVAYQRLDDPLDYDLPQGYSVADLITNIQGELSDGFFASGITSETGDPVLAIRGTSDALDAVADFDPRGIGVSQVEAAWSDISAWLDANPNAHITGHSLGGAQAQLVAERAAEEGHDIGQVVTFNSPGISEAVATDANMSRIGDVSHFITSGDVVSHAGDHYLPGDVEYYNFDTFSPWNPFRQVLDSHTGHWSQQDLSDDYAFPYGVDDYRLASTSLEWSQLSDPFFSHLYAGEEFDAEYFGLLMHVAVIDTARIATGQLDPAEIFQDLASDSVQILLGDYEPTAGPVLAESLVTRGGTEDLRTSIGLEVFKFLKGLELAQAAWEGVSAAVTTAAAWTADVASTVIDWTADTWRGVSGWAADTWDAVTDFTVTAWNGLVDWGGAQWARAKSWTADTWDGVSGWTSDVWESSLEWTSDTFAKVGTFGAETVGAIIDGVGSMRDAIGTGLSESADFLAENGNALWKMAVPGEDTAIVQGGTHAGSTPAVLVAGGTDGTLEAQGGGSVFVAGGGATLHRLGGGDNTVFGVLGELDGDRVEGFGATDRATFANTSFTRDAADIEDGSAVLNIDRDGDGTPESTLRLEGDYDLDAFTILPDPDGTSVFYGAPPDDQVVEVAVEVSDRGGNPVPDASMELLRSYGPLALRQTGDEGPLKFDVMRDVSGRIDGAADFAAADADITASDALEVLRLAVGLEPSFGPAGTQDFIAADIDRSGDVTAQDALEVLRDAVGLETEHAPRWVFLDDADPAQLSSIGRDNVDYDTGADLAAVASETHLSMTGVLLGNMEQYA